MSIAAEVYAILTQQAGARESSRREFEQWFSEGTGHEFRFQGSLGFGGKFLNCNRRWCVTCYSEDETPERIAMIERTNAALSALKAKPAS